LEDDRVEETKIRKEMRRLKSKKTAERWNLERDLEICRKIKERSGKSMDNIFVLYHLMQRKKVRRDGWKSIYDLAVFDKVDRDAMKY